MPAAKAHVSILVLGDALLWLWIERRQPPWWNQQEPQRLIYKSSYITVTQQYNS